MAPIRPGRSLKSFAVSAMLTSALLVTAPGGAYTSAAAGPRPQALVNALAGLRAAAWPGTQSVSIPRLPAAVPAAAVAPSVARVPAPDPMKLSPAEMRRQIALLAQHGSYVDFSAEITRTLGLTSGNQVLHIDEMAYHFSKSPSEKGFTHYFATLPNGGYLLARAKVDRNGKYLLREVFWIDGGQNLVSAYRWIKNDPPVRISDVEAASRLRYEIRAWRAAQAGKYKI